MTLRRPQAIAHLCGIFFMLFTLGFIPLIELPLLSLTTACRGVANAVLAVVLCGVPKVAVILAGTPAL